MALFFGGKMSNTSVQVIAISSLEILEGRQRKEYSPEQILELAASMKRL